MAEGQQAVIEVPARDVASESGPDTVDIEAVRPVLDEHQESILGRCRQDRRSATSDSCSTGDRRSVLQKLTPLQLRPPTDRPHWPKSIPVQRSCHADTTARSVVQEGRVAQDEWSCSESLKVEQLLCASLPRSWVKCWTELERYAPSAFAILRSGRRSQKKGLASSFYVFGTRKGCMLGSD